MKVCFLTTSLSHGGAERTIKYLAEYIASKGHDVDILMFGDYSFYELSNNVNVIKLNLASKGNIFKRIIYVVRRIIAIKQYSKKNKVDVLFCMLYPLMEYRSCFSSNVKSIVSERSNPLNITDKKAVKRRNKLFQKADGVIFQTERAKSYYKDILNNKNIVVPNAVHNEYLDKLPIVEVRDHKICAAGSLKKEKDYFTLIEAFALVLHKHKDYKLEIYGSGPLKDKILSYACEKGIGDNFYIIDACPDYLLKMASAKCYVLSSISEGMPNALMEAMAAGIPCVATDCPNGPSELIEDGENGLLVPIRNPIMLAEAITKMIEDEAFAENCAKNAKKINKTNSIDEICSKMLDFIIEVRKN